MIWTLFSLACLMAGTDNAHSETFTAHAAHDSAERDCVVGCDICADESHAAVRSFDRLEQR